MARARFTITIPVDLGRFVEEEAERLEMKKSAVIAYALQLYKHQRYEELMREGYEEMNRQMALDASAGAEYWPEY